MHSSSQLHFPGCIVGVVFGVVVSKLETMVVLEAVCDVNVVTLVVWDGDVVEKLIEGVIICVVMETLLLFAKLL